MIFVTIGTQEPFDRLIQYMEKIALNFPDQEIKAQIFSASQPIKNMEVVEFLDPKKFDKMISDASIIVSHAGMGSIISALTKNKPIIVVPRLASLKEHRNDHQIATVKKLKDLGGLYVATNESELENHIHQIINYPENLPQTIVNQFASASLLNSIRDFILVDKTAEYGALQNI